MTVNELINLLQAIVVAHAEDENLDVLCECENTGSRYGINVFDPRISIKTANDEYPEDFNMPEGFRFLSFHV